MRGNGVNVLRIAPYSAVQFSSYELFKGVLASNGAEIDTPRRLIAGSLAGICSVISTYPLDLVRSRLSIEVSWQLPVAGEKKLIYFRSLRPSALETRRRGRIQASWA